MIKKKLSKLIGLKYDDFLEFRKAGRIVAEEARLIPL